MLRPLYSWWNPFDRGTILNMKGALEDLYTGKEKDSTGLSYYGARYYNSELGRFITRDLLAGKIIIPQSLNLYTYCLNNPVTFIDPAGLTGLESYCKGDGEDRICVDIFESGWTAYRNGKKLSSSEIQKMIDEGNYVEAVKLILEFLGYTIIGTGTKIMDGVPTEYLTVSINGKNVVIFIYDPDDVEKIGIENPPLGKTSEAMGATMDKTLLAAVTAIYFFSGGNMTTEELFHTVGHEMVHAQHYATGQFAEWRDRWNPGAAEALSEYLAYRWNVNHLYIANFPGAKERYESWMNGWLRVLSRRKGR